MNELQTKAIKMAGQIRRKLKISMFDPINIYDSCIELGVDVRFVEINMEGMYLNLEGARNPTILLSCLRPMPRRAFTCGHELGHHLFGHALKIDMLSKDRVEESYYDKDEYLVDLFAGALLMPIAGIEAAFVKRCWKLQNASAVQFYVVSSLFGVGFSTLVKHCKTNKLIDEAKKEELLKNSPLKLLQLLMQTKEVKSHFKIIDEYTDVSTIDLEVGNYLILPSHMQIEGKNLRQIKKTNCGDSYIAEYPGVIRAASIENANSYFIRIQNSNYTGFAENRHLE